MCAICRQQSKKNLFICWDRKTYLRPIAADSLPGSVSGAWSGGGCVKIGWYLNGFIRLHELVSLLVPVDELDCLAPFDLKVDFCLVWVVPEILHGLHHIGLGVERVEILVGLVEALFAHSQISDLSVESERLPVEHILQLRILVLQLLYAVIEIVLGLGLAEVVQLILWLA